MEIEPRLEHPSLARQSRRAGRFDHRRQTVPIDSTRMLLSWGPETLVGRSAPTIRQEQERCLDVLAVAEGKGSPYRVPPRSLSAPWVGLPIMVGRVDYRTAARVYERGRALPREDLDRWQEAVVRLLPPVVNRVLDLGAGTGIFARAWSGWGARLVTACEPSAEMRAEAKRLVSPDNVKFVAGRGEEIPLRNATADVVWLSTVVHHLSDFDAAASEVHRVLVPRGLLLVRNLFADLGTTPWLAELPGADRARQVFPSTSDLARRLADHNFSLVETVEVTEGYRLTAHDAAVWIQRMRTADSLLLAFTDREITAGLERLASYPEGYTLGPSRIGLAAFRRLE
jgi:ubiquinone/menaquinone biosynthesis C-methylase UbiE